MMLEWWAEEYSFARGSGKHSEKIFDYYLHGFTIPGFHMVIVLGYPQPVRLEMSET